MAKKRRRRIHSVQDLVRDMADDVKDLVKHEFDAMGREKDRGSGPRSERADRRDRGSRQRAEELEELRDAIQALSVKVTSLAADDDER